MGQTADFFKESVNKEVHYNYYLYLPKNYSIDKSKKWPLILFLHGVGERGNNLELVKIHGIPKVFDKNDDFPFVAVSPQCPENSWWVKELDNLDYFLNNITDKYNIDTSRIYLTGMSMGGYGTWFFAMAHPGRFAAIAPVCGGGMPWNAETLKDTCVWAFHGGKDSVVSVAESENMVKAIKECGGDARLTIYPEVDHDSWVETYNNPELYKWFLAHQK